MRPTAQEMIEKTITHSAQEGGAQDSMMSHVVVVGGDQGWSGERSNGKPWATISTVVSMGKTRQCKQV